MALRRNALIAHAFGERLRKDVLNSKTPLEHKVVAWALFRTGRMTASEVAVVLNCSPSRVRRYADAFAKFVRDAYFIGESLGRVPKREAMDRQRFETVWNAHEGRQRASANDV